MHLRVQVTLIYRSVSTEKCRIASVVKRTTRQSQTSEFALGAALWWVILVYTLFAPPLPGRLSGGGGEIISRQRRRRACPVQSTEVAAVENDTVRCTVRRVDHSSAVRPYCPPDRQSTYCPRRTYTQSGYIITMYMLHIDRSITVVSWLYIFRKRLLLRIFVYFSISSLLLERVFSQFKSLTFSLWIQTFTTVVTYELDQDSVEREPASQIFVQQLSCEHTHTDYTLPYLDHKWSVTTVYMFYRQRSRGTLDMSCHAKKWRLLAERDHPRHINQLGKKIKGRKGRLKTYWIRNITSWTGPRLKPDQLMWQVECLEWR